MTLEGLPLAELGKLFAIFGGAMVLLYILRLRRRRVQVPFSPLWSRVVVEHQASSLFRALKRVGSLLVQLAIVALVVLALGDPKVGSFAGCTHEDDKPPPPRHALLVIDASASMSTIEGGRSRLEVAREKAHEIVDRLAVHPLERVMVVQLDARTRPLTLWTSDAAVLHAAIDKVAPDADGGALDTPTAIDDVLRLADDALRGREGGETILVSDFAFPEIPKARRDAIRLSAVAVGAPADNLGIAAFNVRPYLDDSVTYIAWYEVKNETPRPVKANLFLYANPAGHSASDFVDASRLVHTEPLTLPPGETLRGHVPELKFQGSRLFARLVVDSTDPTRDAFPRDDVAFAVVPERRVLSVQLVTEGNLFINAALFLRENVKLTTRTPAEYTGPEGYDVTVVDAVDVDVSRPGNYLVIAPRPSATFAVKGVAKNPLVGKVDKKHPLARHVSFADLNALEAAVYETAKQDEVVVAAEGGAPLLFTRTLSEPTGARRFVVLAFDLRQSLLPMNYAFPLLVVNAISWFWQDAEGLLQPNRAGVPLQLQVPGASSDIAVRGPDGATVPARRVGERVYLSASRLGIWEVSDRALRADESPPTAVAVNLLSPEESRISPQPADYATWTAPVLEEVRQNPWLADFWRVLLLAAIAVVLIEWVTWHRRVTI